MVYDITVDVNYKENCEFNSSQDSCSLQIEEQSTECTLTILDINDELIQESIQIGNKCKLKAEVTSNGNPVKIGSIKISRVIERTDENNNIEEYLPIMDDICAVDNDGTVTIEYQPSTTGVLKFKAEYQDEHGLFSSSATTQHTTLNVHRISTITTFCDATTDYITDIKKEVSLSARVTSFDGQPIKYGYITFLYYKDPDVPLTEDTPAYVIGNPVFVNENGVATIQYIPEQTFDFLDKKYYENIFAVYNYNNEDFGAYWNFYEESRAKSKVYIVDNGLIDVNLYTQGDELETYDYKWAHIQEGEPISLTTEIFDSSGNSIVFSNDDSINIYIQGVHVTSKNNTYTEYNSYQEYVENNFNFANFIAPEIQVTTKNNEGKFFIENLNEELNNALNTNNENILSPGYYIIYATFDAHHTNVREEFLNEYINIDEYVQSLDKSILYYLQIDYEEQSNVTLSMEETYYIEPQQSPSLIAQVNNLSDIDKLVGATCYYYIPKISDTVIEGIFYKENNTLKIRPKENIVIYNAGTYKGYIKIKEGIYKNIKLPAVYSPQFTIKVYADINPELIIISQTDYPGTIEYQLNVPNIVDDIIEAQIYIDDNDPIEQLFDETAQSFNGVINNLSVGEHTILAKVFVKNEIKTVTQTVTIGKSEIDYEIADETKNDILATPTAQIRLLLSCSGNIFEEIEGAQIQIDNNKIINVTEDNIEYKNENSQCIITFNSSVIEEGEHSVKFLYENDNFTANNHIENFNVISISPEYIIQLNEEDKSYIITVTNNYAQVIPIYISMYDDIYNTNDSAFECLVLTDTSGKAIIPYDSQYDYDEWRNFGVFKLYISSSKNGYNDYNLEPTDILLAQNNMYQSYGYDIWFAYLNSEITEYSRE